MLQYCVRPSFCESGAQPNPSRSRPHSLPWMLLITNYHQYQGSTPGLHAQHGDCCPLLLVIAESMQTDYVVLRGDWQHSAPAANQLCGGSSDSALRHQL
jgi:hypothetical protein